MEHRKPKAVSRKLDPEKQAALIKAYEDLLNHLDADEAVLFGDAVHPTHAVRPVGCWAPKDTKVAVAQTSGRQRLNIYGAIDLETGRTRMVEAATVDAASTIMLLMAIEATYPGKRMIHLLVDNARYHHAKLVQAWLAQPGRRIKLRFIPAYCPHLDPIERLWGLMHKHITHNRCHTTFADFRNAILTFLREEVPRKWHVYCDEVSDNFRVISPKDFRILAGAGYTTAYDGDSPSGCRLWFRQIAPTLSLSPSWRPIHSLSYLPSGPLGTHGGSRVARRQTILSRYVAVWHRKWKGIWCLPGYPPPACADQRLPACGAGRWVMIDRGIGGPVRRNVSPGSPFCPPGFLPDAARRLLIQTDFASPSLDGGLPLLLLFSPSRRSSSASCAACLARRVSCSARRAPSAKSSAMSSSFERSSSTVGSTDFLESVASRRVNQNVGRGYRRPTNPRRASHRPPPETWAVTSSRKRASNVCLLRAALGITTGPSRTIPRYDTVVRVRNILASATAKSNTSVLCSIYGSGSGMPSVLPPYVDSE